MSLDTEWVELLLETKQLGLKNVEIREFLQLQEK
nr:DNA-binding anti-repressor SinI [Bacillus sp. OV322]